MPEIPPSGDGRQAAATLSQLLVQARTSGDFTRLVQAVPFSRFVGISMSRGPDDSMVGTLAFAPHLVGNSFIPALHGGALGALLESTAVFGLIAETQAEHPPRIISITIEYLRSARTVDTFARAEIIRQGRRVATVRATAWQEDAAKPVAAANAQFLLPPRAAL